MSSGGTCDTRVFQNVDSLIQLPSIQLFDRLPALQRLIQKSLANISRLLYANLRCKWLEFNHHLHVIFFYKSSCFTRPNYHNCLTNLQCSLKCVVCYDCANLTMIWNVTFSLTFFTVEANDSLKQTCKQDFRNILTYNLVALWPSVNQQSRLVRSSTFGYLTLTVQITPVVESAGWIVQQTWDSLKSWMWPQFTVKCSRWPVTMDCFFLHNPLARSKTWAANNYAWQVWYPTN